MNLLQGQIQCLECKSKKLIKDYERQEVYCSKCGLILVDNSISTLQQRKIQADHKDKEPKHKKTKKIQYHRLKKFFYNFY